MMLCFLSFLLQSGRYAGDGGGDGGSGSGGGGGGVFLW